MHDAASFRLLNAWQRGFPLVPRPFAAIAAQCAMEEREVLERYRALLDAGVIDRIGPVFRPNTVGASTLAAMAVPEERLEDVAALVSAAPGVNHNYEREHRFNLWFVVTRGDGKALQKAISSIEEKTRIPVLRLPLVEEFHIDLGFDLVDLSARRGASAAPRAPALDAAHRRLVERLQTGLPLVGEPYAEVGQAVGLAEEAVIATLAGWLEAGIVRRFGAVVRHRPLGYSANAMVVWDVADDAAGPHGRRLAEDGSVTLCYRRARAPQWPYNLYCMLHGRERAAVAHDIERVTRAAGLEGAPRAVLFSRRCFAQRGARYGLEPAHG
jgi:siroheme decarboxylase